MEKKEKKVERFEEKIKTFKAGQKMQNKNDDCFVYEVEGEKDGEIFACLFRAPNRDEMRMAYQINSKDTIQANEFLVDKCWLDGDEIIKTNDKYFLGLSSELKTLLDFKQGELKKV
jgi:hypothetical protein